MSRQSGLADCRSQQKDPIAGKQWLAQYGKFFKIGGPLLVVISLLLATAKFFGRGA